MEPLHNNHLDVEHSQILAILLNAHFDKCHELKLNVRQRRFLLEKLLDYYRYHIENLPVINSHLILKEILG